MTDENDRSIFNDTPEDATEDAPCSPLHVLDPSIAQGYQAAALMLAVEGENAMAKRLKPAKDDPRLIECRRFLQALTTARGDDLPILFHVVMRDSVADVHSAPPKGRHRLPAKLFGSMTAFSNEGKKGLRSSLGRAFSVTPGKNGSFPMLATVMGRLFLLNALGYDIHVTANGMLFNHRCKKTCPFVRVLVVELDNATLDEQKALLDAIRPMVAAAVFSGKRSIHLFIPLARPLRNPHCIEAKNWRQFRVLKLSGKLACKFHVPMAEQAAQALRLIVKEKSGQEPDMQVLSNFACLTRAPGFRHGETGRLSMLLHDDPRAKWDNPTALRSVEEDTFNEAIPVWASMGQAWGPLKGGKEGAPCEESVSATNEGVSDIANERQNVGIQGTGNETHERPEQKQETIINARGGYLKKAQPTRPTTEPVLSKDVNKAAKATPKSCFLDDLDEFERLLVGGIPIRHQRLKMHGVVLNATRTLGWMPKADAAPESWVMAKDRLLRNWRIIMEKTSPGNVGIAAIEDAISDFAQHIDSSFKNGKLTSFKPRMPDFRSLPDLSDDSIEPIRRRLLDLMVVGILPSLDGGARRMQSGAMGIARIIVGMLWPLAQSVPQQCLDGTASLSAAKLRALCPSRRHKPVVLWLAEANVLRVTRGDYARFDPDIGRGRTRLWRVNLPLLAWISGVNKERLSWTLHKVAKCVELDEITETRRNR
jgi:hypothetical protein